MSVVVSDTSPIRALNQLGLVHLLSRLYGDVLIPPGVADELRDPASALAPLEWTSIPGARMQTLRDGAMVQRLRGALDQGESEGVVLALEVQAAALLVDEREARSIAAFLGLKPVGVLGTLVRAKAEGLVRAVGPLMDRLRAEIDFWISEPLYAEILRLAGE